LILAKNRCQVWSILCISFYGQKRASRSFSARCLSPTAPVTFAWRAVTPLHSASTHFCTTRMPVHIVTHRSLARKHSRTMGLCSSWLLRFQNGCDSMLTSAVFMPHCTPHLLVNAQWATTLTSLTHARRGAMMQFSAHSTFVRGVPSSGEACAVSRILLPFPRGPNRVRVALCFAQTYCRWLCRCPVCVCTSV
jgi:hypothetical protein